MAEWSNRYPYDESNVNHYTPTSGGVYRLIYKSSEKYYGFYVGQGNDLKRRLLEHLKPSEPDECIKKYLLDYKCYFRFIIISSSVDRDRIERENIEEYKPSCNG